MGRRQYVRGRARSESKGSGPSAAAARRALWEGLEARQMLCGTVLGQAYHLSLWADTQGGSSSASASVAAFDAPALPTTADVSIAATAPNGMPLLHSLPGAPTAV